MEFKVTLEEVKRDLLSLGPLLEEAEAVGIFGSLARGDFRKGSDIDVFVIVSKNEGMEQESLWHKRIRDALKGYPCDKTILLYSIKGLRMISNWHVFSLASDGIIVYDKGQVKHLFDQILKKAEEVGLVRERFGRDLVWTMGRKLKWGEIIKVSLE